jgi:hypothetical protein
MKRHYFLLLACLLPVSCGTVSPPPVARTTIPVGAFGTNQDPDFSAVTLSSYIFATPGRMAGNPVGVARATASVEYLAGALYTNPRWQTISSYVPEQMLQARAELHQTLGIAPGSPPQFVVNGLLGAADAIQVGDAAAATVALNPAIFTLGPQQTINVLAQMPFQPIANVATARLNSEFLSGGNRRDCVMCR